MLKISFLSLYSQQLTSFFERGIISRAIENNHLTVEYKNLRDFSDPPHHKVDDYPFSNKKGMLLKYDVLNKAIKSFETKPIIIMPDPKGVAFKAEHAKMISDQSHVVFLSPAFEGVDDRIFSKFDIHRYSMGDFILLNGDAPSMMMAEAAVRYLPNILGCSDCVEDDSILTGLLEAPQFTAPRSIDQLDVPEVLLSGNHREIDRWKYKQSLYHTLFTRPDLINGFKFDKKSVNIVDQIIMEDIE